MISVAQTETSFYMLTPGILEAFDRNFRFRQKFIDSAENTMKKVQKRKKNIDLYIGVHVRRTDYQDLEKVRGMNPVKASYYLEAMDLYKNYYSKQKLVFFVISDDIAWCKANFGKKSKNVIFASNPKMSKVDGIGHDLSLMSMMNHTILSRGSFSFWAGFMAGYGAKVYPCHFPAYQSLEHNSKHICYRHPLEKPIKRIHPFTN